MVHSEAIHTIVEVCDSSEYALPGSNGEDAVVHTVDETVSNLLLGSVRVHCQTSADINTGQAMHFGASYGTLDSVWNLDA